MKKLTFLIALILITGITFAQDGQILKKNFNLSKGAPTLRLWGDLGVIDFNQGDITLTNSATNTLTLAGGTLVVPTLSVTSTSVLTGAATLTGGYSLPTASTHIWASGGSTVLATAGTDVACANGTRFWTEIQIPYNMTITGLTYLIGSVGGTDSVMVHLYNSAGTLVATSRHTGATHGAIVGTAANFQSVAFTTTYSATAGLYYACVQFNGTTAKFRAYPIPGSKFIAGSASGTWDTAANITPGTTFTADKGPICITY